MNLKVLCSPDVAAMSQVAPEQMTWQVDSTVRIGHEKQILSLKLSLQMDFPEVTLEEAGLELCYYQGGIGAPIDLQRTPKELFHENPSVYLRRKGATSRLSDPPPDRSNTNKANTPAPQPQRYGIDDKRTIEKLRLHFKPSATQQCPICDRMEPNNNPSFESHSRPGRSSMKSNPIPIFGQSHLGYDPSVAYSDGPGNRHNMHDVSVQCGQAGRVNVGEHIDVRFGGNARLRETGHAALEGPQPLRTAQQQSAAAELEDAVASLRHDIQRGNSEIIQLKKQLEEMKAQRDVALQWRKEHVCNPTEEVRKLREQLDILHHNLRDVLRGREEALVFLGQRRTVGVQNYQDPLSHRAPRGDMVYPTPVKDLLATSSASPTPRSGNDNAPSPHNATTPALATQLDSGWKKEHLATGFCILRVNSVHSQPFYVKRAVGTRVDMGRHVMTLSSLDGVVTDEIWLDEVEVVKSDPNTNAILVMTRHNRWTLFFNDAEKSKWLKWYYTLNPYLSANEQMGAIPNSL